MADDNDLHVTLDDVATDRMRFAEAQKHLKARAPLEFMLGGTVFTVGFAVAVWFLRPSTSPAIYMIIAVTSFLVSGIAVFLNAKKRDDWYRAKGEELDSVEARIRSGERVLRPNSALLTDTGTSFDKVDTST
jgi:hypothetical protein